MKKILTASLVAIMAVTAANADIASTKYVTDITGNKAFTGSVQGSADLTAAVNALAGKIDTVAGEGQGSVAQQITTALSGATADDFSDSVKTSLGLADTAVQTTTFNTFKGENTTAIATAKQEAIDAAKSAGDIAYAGKSLETTVSNMDAAYKAADTAINDKIGNVAEGKTVVEMIGEAQNAATYNDTEVRGLISGNAGEISTIKGEQTTQNNKISALETSLTAEGDTGKAIAAAQKAGEDAQAAADKAQGDIDAYKISNDKAVTDLTTELGKVQSGETLGTGAVKLGNLDTAVQTSLAEADSAVQKSEVMTGTANGTISVQGSDVAVKGLGSAAYTDSSAYDTVGSAAQALADAKADTQTQVKNLQDTLTALATFPTACAEGTTDCALVIRSGTMQWEKVSY